MAVAARYFHLDLDLRCAYTFRAHHAHRAKPERPSQDCTWRERDCIRLRHDSSVASGSK